VTLAVVVGITLIGYALPKEWTQTPPPILPAGATRITQADLGPAWPLANVASVTVWQEGAGEAFARDEASGTVYALNGLAKSAGAADTWPVQLPDARVPRTKLSTSPLLDVALRSTPLPKGTWQKPTG
jgi:hypothetical protein